MNPPPSTPSPLGLHRTPIPAFTFTTTAFASASATSTLLTSTPTPTSSTITTTDLLSWTLSLLTPPATDDPDEDELKRWSSFIGIIVAIAGNVLISLALNIQKYAHVRLRREKRRRWALGRRRRRRREEDRWKRGLEAGGVGRRRGAVMGENGEGERIGQMDGDEIPEDTEAEAEAELELELGDVEEEVGLLSGGGSDDDGLVRVPSASNGHARGNGNGNGNGNGHTPSSSTTTTNTSTRPRQPPARPKSSMEEPAADQMYLRSPWWWLGLIVMFFGECGNFLAYGFAPASIVSTLGVVALISNCVIAPVMLKEPFRRRDFLGVVVSVLGAVIVVSSSAPEEVKLGPDQIIDAISQPAFIIYFLITLSLIVTLMTMSRKYGSKLILIDLGLVALFGGYTVLSTKGISSLLSSSLYHIFTMPIAYLFGTVLASTAILQIKYINRALQRFDSTQVIPTQFVLFTVAVIVGSGILYRDFENVGGERLGRFVVGCGFTFWGVYLITSGRPGRGGQGAGAGTGTGVGESEDEYAFEGDIGLREGGEGGAGEGGGGTAAAAAAAAVGLGGLDGEGFYQNHFNGNSHLSVPSRHRGNGGEPTSFSSSSPRQYRSRTHAQQQRPYTARASTSGGGTLNARGGGVPSVGKSSRRHTASSPSTHTTPSSSLPTINTRSAQLHYQHQRHHNQHSTAPGGGGDPFHDEYYTENSPLLEPQSSSRGRPSRSPSPSQSSYQQQVSTSLQSAQSAGTARHSISLLPVPGPIVRGFQLQAVMADRVGGGGGGEGGGEGDGQGEVGGEAGGIELIDERAGGGDGPDDDDDDADEDELPPPAPASVAGSSVGGSLGGKVHRDRDRRRSEKEKEKEREQRDRDSARRHTTSGSGPGLGSAVFHTQQQDGNRTTTSTTTTTSSTSSAAGRRARSTSLQQEYGVNVPLDVIGGGGGVGGVGALGGGRRRGAGGGGGGGEGDA